MSATENFTLLRNQENRYILLYCNYNILCLLTGFGIPLAL